MIDREGLVQLAYQEWMPLRPDMVERVRGLSDEACRVLIYYIGKTAEECTLDGLIAHSGLDDMELFKALNEVFAEIKEGE